MLHIMPCDERNNNWNLNDQKHLHVNLENKRYSIPVNWNDDLKKIVIY